MIQACTYMFPTWCLLLLEKTNLNANTSTTAVAILSVFQIVLHINIVKNRKRTVIQNVKKEWEKRDFNYYMDYDHQRE